MGGGGGAHLKKSAGFRASTGDKHNGSDKENKQVQQLLKRVEHLENQSL